MRINNPRDHAHSDLTEFADFAVTIATEARDIGQKYFRQPHDVSSKSDGTPVTIADLEIEQRARLLIAEQYPDHGVYGEEEKEKTILIPSGYG